MQLTFSSATRVALPALLGSLTLLGCSPDQVVPASSAGPLNVSQYLAVGDNYTAGYSDGGLTLSSQQYSIPALLDQQFALTLGRVSTFPQPTLPEGTGTGYLRLQGFDASGLPQTKRVTTGRSTRGSFINPSACGGSADTTFLYSRATNTLPQNLGVPFMRLSQIETKGLGNEANLQRIGLFNPFLERLLPANDERTYLQAVTDASASATFFTFSMGLGDVLPYLLSGGSCTSANPTSAAISLMKANVKKILDKVSDNGRRPGIIYLAPYSMNQLPILGRGSIARVQALAKSNDTIYVQASTLSGAVLVRPMSAKNDYILPSGLAEFGKRQNVVLPGGGTASLRYGLHYRNPIKLRDVLDEGEFGRVNQAVTTINDEAVRLADKVYKLPVINRSVNGVNLYSQISLTPPFNGISVNGVKYTDELIRGNFYSLDQYSLTPRGNAIMANAIIREINRFYKASIPLLDPNTLPTTAHP
ncbi:SGNH/GDSL hydrolase family protein [Hymenobacter fastidiosus]|uniref:SGNH/GDSL hydrolase family protein n=1 Tax=Hymenobacter fastidiosus TaxID=486264 RepID=A0ABP7RM62_9BACT